MQSTNGCFQVYEEHMVQGRSLFFVHLGYEASTLSIGEIPVGMMGPDPGLELFSQTNPCTTSPFVNSPWSVD